ncbi:hypothetical protein DYBT9623_00457 [Dyadobacter sp. CECT 9623]|jgi:hypothetical protein|uniref:Uncharacterized protein n=1 Tax=Dyadobacter linearis TaxID=2823330 RepID=A0ABM8UJW5_9BACT|nr:hypothetical protein DYBT9623_00457 [Dyadobacter sp. CECT 9623]
MRTLITHSNAKDFSIVGAVIFTVIAGSILWTSIIYSIHYIVSR